MEEHVNHPNHYKASNGIETIDVIAGYTSNLNGVVAFDVGNALKYICRFTKKNGTEDLKKAIWYLNHAIESYAPDEKEN